MWNKWFIKEDWCVMMKVKIGFFLVCIGICNLFILIIFYLIYWYGYYLVWGILVYVF